MKKITFTLLVALIFGNAFAQDAETATATANAAADIVSPIGISSQQDLNFGKVANNEAGTVVVATDSDFSTSTLSQIGSTTPTAASFNVTAADGFSYSITLPGSVDLSNGTDDITVDEFKHDAEGRTTGTGSAQTVGVGATLNVASAQATGNYTGTFDVTVTYE
ncbi:hypothetical protein APR41_06650 [Salegentibacter salinarum]|uniref:DUF4402 domain-containing protein n=1 Tax=Salegentibacter salinarum TaxID=447422 RepID=A0A2N0TQY5_9FLAO|nr:DUF4402 domain-containing protein [Salegentibacter salinarum]PKD17108.1 hypothetical protein APR41_06650 [Salegentibacter salinarum]SKB55033.1 protein of unknown function [Salegentibacter salinarum]